MLLCIGPQWIVDFTSKKLFSSILTPLHPPKLLPHMQLIPLLNPTLNLPVLYLKDSRSMPRRLIVRRLDTAMRLTAMAPRRAVPQTHVPASRKDDVVRVDVQGRHGVHDFRMRVCIVLRRFAVGECGWRDEICVGVAEVLDGRSTFVLFG